MLMLLPFYHGYGISTMMIGLISRCTMIIMSIFEPKLFLTLVQKYKVTHLPVVPSILTFLAKHPLVDRYDFRSVRELVCGAAPLGKDVSFLLSLWSLSFSLSIKPLFGQVIKARKAAIGGTKCRSESLSRLRRENQTKDYERKSQRVVAFSLDMTRGVTLSRSFLFNQFTKSLRRSRGEENKRLYREFAIASFGKCETDLLSVNEIKGGRGQGLKVSKTKHASELKRLLNAVFL